VGPFALGPDEVAALLDRARRGAEWAARATPLEVVLQPVPAWTRSAPPTRPAPRWPPTRPRAATALAVRVVHRSPDHYVEQLEALLALTPD